MLNQEREKARGRGLHGSVGVGFGETISYSLLHPTDAPRAQDLTTPHALLDKLQQYHQHARAQGFEIPVTDKDIIEMRDALVLAADPVHLVPDELILETIQNGPIIFEGAQGFLLDEWYGFHPHTTWSTTTPKNALKLLDEAGELGNHSVVGVTRSYHTRHGAGPFPTEDMFPCAPTEQHNRSDGVQGVWRSGAFDLVMARYALSVVRPDALALTFADVKTPVMDGDDLTVPTSWVEEEERLAQQEEMGKETMSSGRTEAPVNSTEEFQEMLMEMGKVDHLLVSTGPSPQDKDWITR